MWIKTNFDFGMPIADFTLSVRRLQALKLRDAEYLYQIGYNDKPKDDA